MVLLLQLLIVSIWAFTLITHTRRLIRLARLEQARRWNSLRLRTDLNRIWWWLGQETFWRDVQEDGWRCVQLTLMIFLLAWGMKI